MSSVMKGALNKMTIKQAFDEVNATDASRRKTALTGCCKATRNAASYRR